VGINLDKPQRWKQDTAASVDLYNSWFMEFAPAAFRDQRLRATDEVEAALRITDDLAEIAAPTLQRHPGLLPILRAATCPPIARDRLSGLAGVSPGLVGYLEEHSQIPPRSSLDEAARQMQAIALVLSRLLDRELFPWLAAGRQAEREELRRAASVVADRLCGAQANPIIRNAQERRQLALIEGWLARRGYSRAEASARFDAMEPGSFGFRMNVPVHQGGGREVKIPMDVVVKPLKGHRDAIPLFIEAKSAGDFTNVNKRRKEEATKMAQLRGTFGVGVHYLLFLCGYFDSGYLGYEASEGIDWVWEHRMDELAEAGL
jgi:type II restriction enzyme